MPGKDSVRSGHDPAPKPTHELVCFRVVRIDRICCAILGSLQIDVQLRTVGLKLPNSMTASRCFALEDATYRSLGDGVSESCVSNTIASASNPLNAEKVENRTPLPFLQSDKSVVSCIPATRGTPFKQDRGSVVFERIAIRPAVMW